MGSIRGPYGSMDPMGPSGHAGMVPCILLCVSPLLNRWSVTLCCSLRTDVQWKDGFGTGLHPESQLAWTLSIEHRMHVEDHSREGSKDPRRRSRDLSGRTGHMQGLTRHEKVRYP